MTKHRITALAAALAVTAAGAGAATAATTKKAPGPAAQFQSRLAKELGVSESKLRSATKDSGVATVRGLQAAGKLDATKAAKLEKAVEAGRAVPFTQLGKHGAKRAFRPVVLLAKAIGAKPKDVRAALKSGKTPAAIIAAAGKDPVAVKATIKSAVRVKLAKRVTAGKLTDAKADARAEKVAARLTADQPLQHGKKQG